MQAVTRVNAEQAAKQVTWEPTRLSHGEGRCSVGVSRATEKKGQESRGIGDEPTNPIEGSDTPGSVAPLLIDTEVQVGRINRRLRGWANSFCLGPVSNAYRAVDRHTAGRLRQWLRRKHQVQGRGTARHPDAYLYQTLTLVRLTERTRTFAWANA
jgi:hypothetical protein